MNPIPFTGLFAAKMTIGTVEGRDFDPKKSTLDMLVDTGSSWNWVMSCNNNTGHYWEKHKCPYFDES
jgi:hypothetical protein